MEHQAGQRTFRSGCLLAALLVFAGCNSATTWNDASTNSGFDSHQTLPEKDGANLASEAPADASCILTSSCALVTGGSTGSAGTLAAGGSVGSGGSTATGGNSGSTSTLATGGSASTSAGMPATGGTLSSAGATATGGVPASAGASATSRDAGTGGATSAGGSKDASDTKTDTASCTGWNALVHLSPQQLKDLLAAQDVFLINVRSPNAPDIAGTDLSLQTGTDVTPTVTAIEELVKNNTCADIVIYCVSGNTSQRVATPLIDKGYLRVRDLQGGMNAWQSQGFPVTKLDGGTN